MKRSKRDREIALFMWGGCGVLFAGFAFSFLYVMQADYLAAVQHVLSHGQTVYSPFWGAFILTLLLSVLPPVVARRFTVPTWATAFFYFPSCLFLALLTAVHFTPAGSCALDASWWWTIPTLILYVLILKVLKHVLESRFKGDVWGRLWPNALLMSLQFGLVGVCSNTDIRLHHELRVARYLQEERYDEALSVGKQSLEVSERLTAMRCYALSRTGRLAEELFEYPMPYGSRGLLPSASDSVGLSAWPEAFYRYMEARPSSRLEGQATTFFRLLSERPEKLTPVVADYLLCALLLDKDLDGFVRALPLYYTVDDKLPRYYKEALILYVHSRMSPELTYEDAVLQANYSEYQALRRKEATDAGRYKACRNLYGNTYWFYYHF